MSLASELAELREENRRLLALVDPPICRLQLPDGVVAGNAKECAELWREWYGKALLTAECAKSERDLAWQECRKAKMQCDDARMCYAEEERMHGHTKAALAEATERNKRMVCAYCHAFFASVGDGPSRAMAEHVTTCPENPLVQWLAEAERQRDEAREHLETCRENYRKCDAAREALKRELDAAVELHKYALDVTAACLPSGVPDGERDRWVAISDRFAELAATHNRCRVHPSIDAAYCGKCYDPARSARMTLARLATAADECRVHGPASAARVAEDLRNLILAELEKLK